MIFMTEVAGFAFKECLEAGSGSLLRVLADRVSDQGQRLTRAVQTATEQAWRALEIALAGESLWNKLDRQEDKSFREQIRGYIAAIPLPLLTGKTEFRRNCLSELKKARKDSRLAAPVTLEGLAKRAGALAQYGSPQDILAVETRVLAGMAKVLKERECPSLGWLFEQQPQPGQSVLVIAARYYFRRQVEGDPVLARSLQFSQMEELSQAQKEGFRQLGAVLEQHQARILEALDDVLQVVVEARDAARGAEMAASGAHAAAAGAHSAVLDLQSEMQRQLQGVHQQVQGLYQPVVQLLEQIKAQNQPVRAGHSLSIRTDREQQLVRELLARYRGLPPQEQAAAPALLNGLGKLEVAVGDFAGAEASFDRVAALTGDVRARAEAHYNGYQAALEQGKYDAALSDLRQAIAGDRERFAPFPPDDYEIERILGAGGFGVTFLCRHRLSGGQVAVKSLIVDDLDRDVTKVFEEAQTLDQLNHLAIIRLRHCGYADTARTRPYLVMDYFAGGTLEDHVKKNGPLPVGELLEVGSKIGHALQAAHGKGILHRDVKPANILARKGGSGWEVRLIDFGLALKQEVLENAGTTIRQGKTITAGAIAGTLEYAAPEQIGRLPGARIGSPADVYGFARTCCYALFETPEPTFQNWQAIPQPLAELLGECLNKQPEKRPASFRRVLQRLEAIAQTLRPGSRKSGGSRSRSSDEADLPLVTLAAKEPPAVPVVPPRRTESVPVAQVVYDVAAADDRSGRRGGDRADAIRKKVYAPGLAILIVSLLGLALDLMVALYAAAEGSGDTEAVVTIYMVMAAGAGLGALGGWQMMARGNYALAVAGSIGVMLGSCVCLLSGVAVGIWGLVVLINPEVKDSFG